MKFPFFKKSKPKDTSYFGLFLQEDKMTGYVYEIVGNGIQILGQSSNSFSNGLTNIVEDLDDLLFRLETDTTTKLKKTIFFLTSYYIHPESKEIKKEYKATLKTIVKELELEALGFIEAYEAIAGSHIKHQDETANKILLELDKSKGHVYVYKSSQLSSLFAFDRSENLTHDLKTVLTEKHTGTPYPSHILLYPYNESHKELVHLVNHKWDEHVFSHVPKIQALSDEELSAGLAEIFRSQMLEPDTSADTVPVPPIQISENKVETIPVKDTPKEVMGFKIGEDITEDVNSDPEYADSSDDKMEESEQTSSPKKAFAFPAMAFPKSKLIFIVPVVLLILGLSLFGSEYFLHTATINVTFPKESIEKELSMTGDALNIKEENIEVDVTSSSSTTGKRDIGEKAKGEITLHNFDDKERTIAQGTVLQADSRNFILDQGVKVASASETLINGGYVKQPGKAKGSVVAEELGTEGNLEKGKKFNVGDLSLSQFFAINDEAFSGGTKRQAKTVAKVDIEDLREDILKSGKDKGVEQMKSKVGNQKVIDALTEQEIDTIEFSKEVGDEAAEVNATAKVSTVYYVYSEDDLKNALVKELKSDVPSGYTLTADKVAPRITGAEKDDTITLDIEVKADALKQVPKQEIIDMAAGKGADDLEKIIKSDLKATNYTVEQNGLSIFPFSGKIPMFKKNISVNLVSQ